MGGTSRGTVTFLLPGVNLRLRGLRPPCRARGLASLSDPGCRWGLERVRVQGRRPLPLAHRHRAQEPRLSLSPTLYLASGQFYKAIPRAYVKSCRENQVSAGC